MVWVGKHLQDSPVGAGTPSTGTEGSKPTPAWPGALPGMFFCQVSSPWDALSQSGTHTMPAARGGSSCRNFSQLLTMGRRIPSVQRLSWFILCSVSDGGGLGRTQNLTPKAGNEDHGDELSCSSTVGIQARECQRRFQAGGWEILPSLLCTKATTSSKSWKTLPEASPNH